MYFSRVYWGMYKFSIAIMHCESAITSSVLRPIAPKIFESKESLLISIAADNSMIDPNREAMSNGISGRILLQARSCRK